MTMLDTLLRGQAKSVIRQFGATVTYRRITTEGVFDSDELEEVNATYTESTFKAVAVARGALTAMEQVNTRFPDEEAIVSAGEYVLYIAAAEISFVPEPGEEFDIGSATYTVTAIIEHRSGDQLAMYEVTGKAGDL